jgi:hypothetical protein
MFRLYHPVVRRSPIPLVDVFGVNGATGKKAKNNPDICLTVSEMVSRINATAEKIKGNEVLLALVGNEDMVEKWKGDVFEAWSEFFIRASSIDKKIGIYDYQINRKADYGVDGLGKSIVDLTPATVQLKFRSNPTQLLTSQDGISNFVSNSLTMFGVPQTAKNNMLILTTAKGLHETVNAKMYNNTVRCLGYNELGKMVNKMRGFWEQFISSIEYTNKKD